MRACQRDPVRCARRLSGASADAVQVFWTKPPFDVTPIGEMRIRPCPACSDDKISSKVRPRAAALGANVVVIVDESSRIRGAQLSGNTVQMYEKRRLIAIMGVRK